MVELLVPVLVAAAVVLSLGALLLLGLIAFASVDRSPDASWMQRLLCRMSFERFACCEPAGKAG